MILIFHKQIIFLKRKKKFTQNNYCIIMLYNAEYKLLIIFIHKEYILHGIIMFLEDNKKL